MTHKKFTLGFIIIIFLALGSTVFFLHEKSVQKSDLEINQEKIPNDSSSNESNNDGKIWNPNTELFEKPVSPLSVPIQRGIFYNTFTSRDHQLKFRYKKSWICREISWNERVDCYPEIRQEEESGDMGFEQVSVHFPNISMLIDDCKAEKIQTKVVLPPEDINLLKTYNSCKVEVLAEDGIITDEKKLDSVIFPTDKKESEIITEESQAEKELIKSKAGKKWNTFTDDQYGFSIDYPNTIKGYKLNIDQKECTGSDSKSISLIHPCTNFSIKASGKDDREFGMSLTVELNIENEGNLNEFIQNEFGSTCKLAKIDYSSPLENDLYKVDIAENDEESCSIDRIVKYSPKEKKAVVMELDHTPLFSEPVESVVGEYIDYTNETINSFHFIN